MIQDDYVELYMSCGCAFLWFNTVWFQFAPIKLSYLDLELPFLSSC